MDENKDYRGLMPNDNAKPKSQARVWAKPPPGEIPGSMNTELLLGVSDRAAVYISRPACYTQGLLFDMVAVDRTKVLSGESWLRIIDNRSAKRDERPPEDFLYLGIEFANGCGVDNWHVFGSTESPGGKPKIALTNLGAGNRDRRYAYCRYDWYLWPLPIRGDIIFVCAWPAFGIAETRTTMSGAAVREAGQRAHGALE